MGELKMDNKRKSQLKTLAQIMCECEGFPVSARRVAALLRQELEDGSPSERTVQRWFAGEQPTPAWAVYVMLCIARIMVSQQKKLIEAKGTHKLLGIFSDKRKGTNV